MFSFLLTINFSLYRVSEKKRNAVILIYASFVFFYESIGISI